MSADELHDRTVFDTVVVNYFLAAGHIEILTRLCGSVLVPRAVFDPDEPDDIREEAMSELRRGWHLHRRRAGATDVAPNVQARSVSVLPYFEWLPELASQRRLVAVDLSDQELALHAELRDSARARSYQLAAGLGPGEAAVLALCKSRNLLPATDDTDAIKVAAVLLPGLIPLRIRSLLQAAVAKGLVAGSEAISAHRTMKSLGFWDKQDLSF